MIRRRRTGAPIDVWLLRVGIALALLLLIVAAGGVR